MRHLLPIPFGLLGVAMVAFARPISAFYAGTYRSLDVKRLADSYSSARGPLTIRLAGLAFVGFGVYWTIHGL